MPAAVGWAAWMKFSIEILHAAQLALLDLGIRCGGDHFANSRRVRVAGNDGLRRGGSGHGHADGSDRGRGMGMRAGARIDRLLQIRNFAELLLSVAVLG